jgi:hypothetical protein
MVDDPTHCGNRFMVWGSNFKSITKINMTEPEETTSIGLHTNTPLFEFHIKKKIEENNVAKIIECGTNVGLGSTVVFANTGLPVETCEVNKSNYDEAVKNLKKFKKVKCHHAFTTDKEHCNPVLMEQLLKNGGVIKSNTFY